MNARPEFVLTSTLDASDDDPQETAEWLDAIDGVIRHVGPQRAHYLIERQIAHAHRYGQLRPHVAGTPYVNTIGIDRQPHMPGDA